MQDLVCKAHQMKSGPNCWFPITVARAQLGDMGCVDGIEG